MFQVLSWFNSLLGVSIKVSELFSKALVDSGESCGSQEKDVPL